MILLNKAHYPVTVLGPGRRIGIWVQGCSIRCPGCVSRDTWEADDGHASTVEDLVKWCREASDDNPDGITISGGEPFDQPEALAALLNGLNDWRNHAAASFDILAYSGYPITRLRSSHAALLAGLDAIIPGPYVENLPKGGPLCGSSNQRVIVLSDLGRRRYGNESYGPEAKEMQLHVKDGKIWFVGVPDRGDMEKLEQLCAAHGLSLGRVSWRE